MGIEKSVPYSLFESVQRALKEQKVRIKPVGNLVESLRTVKEEEEIRFISRAGRIAWASLNAALGQLRAGMTEQHLAAIIEYEMRMRGADAGFDTIVSMIVGRNPC